MFFTKKKLPFFFNKAEMEKAAVIRTKTVDGSESGDSFLDEEEIRGVRARTHGQKRWWTGFFLIHLVLFAIYIGTTLNLQSQLAKIRKNGLQLIDCEHFIFSGWKLLLILK